jgi:hypothetical protein
LMDFSLPCMSREIKFQKLVRQHVSRWPSSEGSALLDAAAKAYGWAKQADGGVVRPF